LLSIPIDFIQFLSISFQKMSFTPITIDSTFPIMDIDSDNWIPYLKAFSEICVTAGVAGEQFLAGKTTIRRFPNMPTEKDHKFDEIGESLGLMYARDTKDFTFDMAADPAALPHSANNLIGQSIGAQTRSMTLKAGGIPTLAGSTVTAATTTTTVLVKQFNAKFFKETSMTNFNTTLFEKHILEYTTTQATAQSSDNALYQFARATHSIASIAAIEASPLWGAFPPGCTDKSLRFLNASKSVHQSGSGIACTRILSAA